MISILLLPSRFSKFITHLDLFRKSSKLRGEIVECGVFKGNSLMRWIKFRALLENSLSRKYMALILLENSLKLQFQRMFLKEISLSKKQVIQALLKEFYGYLQKLNLSENVFLVEGDILKTVPEFLKNNKQLRISLIIYRR